MRKCSLMAAVVMLQAMTSSALAQEAVSAYPSKPVRVIVAQSAGGGADNVARLFAAKVGEPLGRQFIIENHPGRDIAWTMVARAKPDGYTLLSVVPDFTFASALYPNLPVNPSKDFEPISLLTRTPFQLVVNAAFPARILQEFIAKAKADDGKVNIAGGLPGTGTHLLSAWFLSQAGIKATYVPYKGISQAVIDLLAGRVDVTFATASATPHIKSGKLRSLGASTAQRARYLPDVPTIQEQGVVFDGSSWQGWAATGGTSAPIINKLWGELAKAAKSPELAKTLSVDNAETVGNSPEEFRKFMAAEFPRWMKVVKESNIKAEDGL